MNKIALLLLAALLSFNAQAKEKFCSYVDLFHPSSASNPYLYIAKLNADREVLVQALSSKSFEIRDAGNCSSGYAHVTYLADPSHYCFLDIKDGPSLWTPQVHAFCVGFTYKGIVHDGGHSYSLNIIL